MWRRRDLKRRGRASLRRNYWAAVAICFVLSFVGAEHGESAALIHRNEGTAAASAIEAISDALDWTITSDIPFLSHALDGLYTMLSGPFDWVATVLKGGTFVLSALLLLLFSAVVINPLIVGGRRFFLVNEIERAGVLDILFSFRRRRLGNAVKVMLLRDIFLLLWSLLLLVPGIVKSYEYRMVPFLLADNPELDHRHAFALSRAMMRGNKWRAFLLDLSFLLWVILAASTLGFLGIFYLNPYIGATDAALYFRLKTDLFAAGAASFSELPLCFPPEEVPV